MIVEFKHILLQNGNWKQVHDIIIHDKLVDSKIF